MKLSTLIATAILATSTTIEAASLQTPRYDTTQVFKAFWNRLVFPEAGGWFPKPALLKKKLDSLDGKYKDWSAEDWAANVLLKCKGIEDCKSCIAFLVIKDNPKDNYWAGYFFSASSGVSDYSKAGAVDKSIGYWVGLGGGSVEVEEQIVLDL